MKKNHTSLLLITGILLLLSACSKIIYKGVWQAEPVKADGIPDEWSKPLRFYDNTTKLQYAFTNDKRTIYVCIRATDEQTQKKILAGGLQLWIDTTGKGKEKTGILFPMPVAIEKTEGNGTSKKEDNPEDYKPRKSTRLTGNEMQLSGFKAPVGGIVPLQNMDGIMVNIKMDKDEILNYEALIPFKTFYHDSLRPSDTTQIFSLKIQVNGIPQQKKNNDQNDPSHSMGSRTAGGMGARGGTRGGGMGPSNPMAESHSVTARFKMIYKP
ncbi:MAG: hypothetical protein ACHQRM_14205 [Bacteroidia bacterium]